MCTGMPRPPFDALQTDAESHRAGLWIRFDDMRADNIPLVGPKDSRTRFSGRLREGEYPEDTDRSREQQDAP